MRSASIVVAVSVLSASGASIAAADAACARLLTAAEVEAAAGAGFQSIVAEESQPGKSECVWLLDRSPNPKAISLRYAQKSAAPSGDLAQLFEAEAKKAEGLHGNPREVVPGIGTRAALVPGKAKGAMIVIVIQTAEGVAYVETDYVERPHVLALAQAIAAR